MNPTKFGLTRFQFVLVVCVAVTDNMVIWLTLKLLVQRDTTGLEYVDLKKKKITFLLLNYDRMVFSFSIKQYELFY